MKYDRFKSKPSRFKKDELGGNVMVCHEPISAMFAALATAASSAAGAAASASSSAIGIGGTTSGTLMGASGVSAATGAGLSSWLSPIMTGVSLLGTGMEMMGKTDMSETAAQIYEANAESAKAAGEATVEAAKGQQWALSKERRQLIGQQAAIMAGSGVDISSGSPLDIMAETAGNYEQDIATLGQTAQEALKAKTYEASIYDWAAERSRKAGLISGLSSGLTGVSNLLLKKKYGLGYA